jgi:hypothetical protein
VTPPVGAVLATVLAAACRAALAGSAAAALLATAASAQTIYRCGPDGRSYSQTPCADGKPLTVDDPRSAEQQRAARGVADREAKTAQQLRDERHKREAAASRDVAIGIGPEPPAAAASAPRKTPTRSNAAPSAKPDKARKAAEPVYVGPAAPRPADKTGGAAAQ